MRINPTKDVSVIAYRSIPYKGAIMEDMLQKMIDIALSDGATYAEARYQKDEYASNLLKNGAPEVASFDVRKGISIRVVVDGGLGFGSTNIDSMSAAVSVAKRTVKSARAAARVRKAPINIGPSEVGKVNTLVRPRVPFDAVQNYSRIDLLKESDEAAVSAAKKGDVTLAGRYISIDTLLTEKHILSSDGADVRSLVPRAVVEAMLMLVGPQGASAQRVVAIGESGGWENVERWDLPKRLDEEVRSVAGVVRSAKPFEGGTMDIVLGPEVVGLIAHESCGHPSEADRVLGREAAQAGETYLDKDAIGKKIGSDQVNVVDDPALPRSFGFYECDDEGVKARRRYLMKDGVVNEFLQNRETAASFNVQSNAASRSVAFNREPIVRMANTFVEPKDHSREELIEGVGHGVYIKDFMEWNIDDRRYNQRYVGLEAYMIENGKLGQMVRNPVLEIDHAGTMGICRCCWEGPSVHIGLLREGRPYARDPGLDRGAAYAS